MFFVSKSWRIVIAATVLLTALAAAGCSNNGATTADDYKKDIMGGNLTPTQKANYEAIARQVQQAEMSGKVSASVSANAASNKATAINAAHQGSAGAIGAASGTQ